jgi:hypothetical protein
MVTREKIYIRLLDEGVDSWLPTTGEKISDNTYKVFPTDDYDADDEVWEFIPGSIVNCELQEKDSGKGEKIKVLVAISKVES